jgi:hypothetical protein
MVSMEEFWEMGCAAAGAGSVFGTVELPIVQGWTMLLERTNVF